MDRLVRDDRKATVTQINTRYNQEMQNTISERTTHRTSGEATGWPEWAKAHPLSAAAHPM